MTLAVYNKEKVMQPPQKSWMDNNDFTLGDTVIFEPKNLNQDYWASLTEDARMLLFGEYGYGSKWKLFTFITHHYPQLGHCLLMDMVTGKLLPMCATNHFRTVSEEEC